MTRRTKSKPLPISDELTRALAEIMPIGDGEAPLAVMGWPGPLRHLKKVVAEYPNGWQLRVNLNRLGQVTSVSSMLRLTGQVRAVPGSAEVSA